MKTLYHVTHRDSLDSIMEKGLLPLYGYRTQITDDLERVYFFKELDEDFENDTRTWMTFFLPREKMVLLKVTLPDDFPGLRERYGWEVMCENVVPSKYIEVMDYSFV